MERVGQADRDQHVVRQDAAIEKLKDAVLGRFDGDDVALEIGQGRRASGLFSPKSHQFNRRYSRLL
jgi:hypothetical protein